MTLKTLPDEAELGRRMLEEASKSIKVVKHRTGRPSDVSQAILAAMPVDSTANDVLARLPKAYKTNAKVIGMNLNHLEKAGRVVRVGKLHGIMIWRRVKLGSS